LNSVDIGSTDVSGRSIVYTGTSPVAVCPLRRDSQEQQVNLFLFDLIGHHQRLESTRRAILYGTTYNLSHCATCPQGDVL